MSEHMFGVGCNEPTAANISKIAAIAKRYGYRFVAADLPDGYKHWFAGPNLGHPFDDRAEREIWAELERANLADANGLIPKRAR